METITTSSVNTPKAWEFLKKNEGNAYTIREIAEACDATTPQVLGGVVSLTKKGHVEKGDEVEVDGKTYKTFMAVPGVELKFETKQGGSGKNLSDGAIQVLQYMQKDPSIEATHAEIAEGMGWDQTIKVVGAVRSLASRGLVEKEAVIVEMPTESGETKEKEVKVVTLTEEGKNYKF